MSNTPLIPASAVLSRREKERRARNRRRHWDFWWLLGTCFIFFLVYVGIHIFLNWTTNGSFRQNFLDCLSNCTKHMPQLSGPITISICSTLLIFSFGLFVLNGLKHLSISAAHVFFRAFLIFVFGQIIVQLTGHAEIFVYVKIYGDMPNPEDEGILKILKPVSALAYPAAFGFLYLLESYAGRAFNILRHQLPEHELRHLSDSRLMGWLTLVSVLLLGLKILVFWLGAERDTSSEFRLVTYILILESLLAVGVVLRAMWRNWHLDEREST